MKKQDPVAASENQVAQAIHLILILFTAVFEKSLFTNYNHLFR